MQSFDTSGEAEACRWQACFPDEGQWRCEALPGLARELWHADGKTAPVYFAVSCASTMDLAWGLTGLDRFLEWSWAAAGLQTEGRGQQGRSWDPAPGNLSATVRLPDRAALAGGMLTLGIGLVVADVLKDCGAVHQIKWPNDLLMGGKKTGGILIEQRDGRIMAGIGLNIHGVPGPAKYPDGYRVPPCSLAQFGCMTDAPALWQRISTGLKENLMPVLASPAGLKRRAEDLLAFRGDDVILERGNGENVLVRLVGLDRSGGLVIETPGGRETVFSGRVIPRIMI